MYNCGYGPTKEEVQILLKSLKPRQKLPLLNDLKCPERFPDQLAYENYLDGLLKGYTLKFVTNRFIDETMPEPCLTMNKRLHRILEGIEDVIDRCEKGYFFITINKL